MTPKTALRALWSFIAEPLLFVGVVFFSTTAIAQPFYVPSGSMQPTLAIGDALIGSKYPYGYSRWSTLFGIGPASETRLLGRMPKRGDVVIFRKPGELKTTLVKRVIGLPGDRIQMIDGRLAINGQTVPLTSTGFSTVQEPDGRYVKVERYVETLPGGAQHPIFKQGWSGWLDNTAVFTVPAGHLFMMGDNRDNSLDSRVAQDVGGVGFVPQENLMARAEITIGSYDFLEAKGPASWPGLLRWDRFFKSI